MYFDKILRIWVMDPIDYFLLSACVGSALSIQLKKYLSEQEAERRRNRTDRRAMRRLAKSIVKQSRLYNNATSQKMSSHAKEQQRLRRIQSVALGQHRGGQFLGEVDITEDKVVRAAEVIQNVITKLVANLRRNEMKGFAKIFFRNGRLFIELVLNKCGINVFHALIGQGTNTQVIIITSVAGGAGGFALSWFAAGAVIATPFCLAASFVIRSFAQQYVNIREYKRFKQLLEQMLNEPSIQDVLKTTFVEGAEEASKIVSAGMEEFTSSNQLPLFDQNSGQTLDEFIRARMKEQLGLIENADSDQIRQIIANRQKSPIGRYSDLITNPGGDNIVDAEIIEKAINGGKET